MRAAVLTMILVGIGPALAEESQILWGNSVNNFSLGLAVSNSAYDLQRPVAVTVYVRNDATIENPLAVAPLECMLSFVVTDTSRTVVETKKPDCSDRSVVSLPILPGDMRATTVDLRDYLFLTNGGKFVVTAKYLLFWPTVALSGNAIIEIEAVGRTNINGRSGPITVKSPGSNSLIISSANTGSSVAGQSVVLPKTAGTPAVAASNSFPVPSPVTGARSFTRPQKIGTGIVVAFLALLAFILLRAKARQKRSSS